MTSDWRIVGCAPDTYSDPAQLDHLWGAATCSAQPAPVAALTGTTDCDGSDWWYRTEIVTAEPVDVTFDGLTFPATVFVDGQQVAVCESMFLPVRIELGPGTHTVCVCCHSLHQWLQTRRPRGRWRSSLVAEPGLRWARTSLLGRAPAFGVAPPPVGIWRPVTVSAARGVRDVVINADPRDATVQATGAVRAASDVVSYRIDGPSGATVAHGAAPVVDGRFAVSVHLDDPLLWWPHGYGPQNLYRISLRTSDTAWQTRTVGLRSVHADTADGGFELIVNDQPIFARGAVWMPPDPVRLLVDEAVIGRQLATLVDAGANMVRVPGGLVYEQPEFWEQCARMGVMVWQDAMQATFDPPAETAELVARELVHVLDGLSGNPSLTVVSGGNETLQRPELLGMTAGASAIPSLHNELPRIVAAHADVPYVPASPAAPQQSNDRVVRPDTGVAHWFGVGAYLRPLADVRSAGVRFAAECLAFANPPPPSAVERHFGSAAAAGHHPDWKRGVPRDRGASWDFEDVRDFYVRTLFGEDPFEVRRAQPERYLQLGRLAVAEATVGCFGYWRRPESRCSGALVLSANDVGPGAGWGLIDFDGEPKAALAVLERVWAPLALVLADEGLSGIRLDIHNDAPMRRSGELQLLAVNRSGHRIVDTTMPVTLEPRSTTTVFDSELCDAFYDLSHSFKFGEAAADGVQAVLRLPDVTLRDVLVVNPRTAQVDSGLQAIAYPDEDATWRLEICSRVALRYVEIDVPGWRVSENFFHLLGATPHHVTLHGGVGRPPAGTVSSIDSLTEAVIVAADASAAGDLNRAGEFERPR